MATPSTAAAATRCWPRMSNPTRVDLDRPHSARKETTMKSMTMKTLRDPLWKSLVWAAMLLALLVPLASHAYLDAPEAKPEPKPVVPPFKGDYKVTNWEMLIPKDWDPYAPFRAESNKFSALSDASPQADELIRKMREVWDNAPTDHALNGARTRLPGYVVPLEETK